MRGSVAVLVQGSKSRRARLGVRHGDGVEFPDDDERTGTFWKDDAGYRGGETAGARDRFGCSRKLSGRGGYLSRVGARGSGGRRRIGVAWRESAGGALRC